MLRKHAAELVHAGPMRNTLLLVLALFGCSSDDPDECPAPVEEQNVGCEPVTTGGCVGAPTELPGQMLDAHAMYPVGCEVTMPYCSPTAPFLAVKGYCMDTAAGPEWYVPL